MPKTYFFTLPREIREMIYDLLVVPRQTIKSWEDSHSQPRKCLISHGGDDIVSWENWWPQDGSSSARSSRWLSSMIALDHISNMLRTCQTVHTELSEFVYKRLVWHARIGRYSVPALPLQVCPRYSHHVRNVSLHLHHGNTLDGILEGTDHVYIKFSSFYRNLQAFCQLLASQCRLKSLEIEALLPSDQAVVDAVEGLIPLKGLVDEIKVGSLGYEQYNRASFRYYQFLSNAGYQKLRQIFGDDVKWTFPLKHAQYKD